MKTLKSITETFKGDSKHDQGIRKPGVLSPPKKFDNNTITSLKGGPLASTLGGQEFVDDHEIEKTPDANGNGDDVFKATNVKPADRKKERHGYDAKESETVYEMSKPQMAKREDVVKSMKKSFGDFKKRYGQDAKSVMYATATKQAMKEEIESADAKYNCILEASRAHKEEQDLVEAYASIIESIYDTLETKEDKDKFMQIIESDDAFDELVEIIEVATAESLQE